MIYLLGDMSVCTEIIRWTVCYLSLNKVIVEEMHIETDKRG